MADVKAGRPFDLNPGRNFWVAFVAASVAATVVAVAGLWPLWAEDRFLAAVTTVLAVTLFVTGYLLLAEPQQERSGWAMMASSGLLVLSWANEWQSAPWPLLSSAGNAWLVGCAWAVYRYPEASLSKAEQRFFWVIGLWLFATPWVTDALSLPQWHHFPSGQWWPALYPNRGVYDVVVQVANAGNLFLLVLYVGMWARRLATARPAIRRVKRPTAVAGVIAAIALAGIPIGGALGAGQRLGDLLNTVAFAGVLTVPAAFFVSVIGRVLARRGVAEVLLSLQDSPSPDRVEASLRKVLRDPALTVGYWSDHDQGYRAGGRLVAEAWADGDAVVAPVIGADGSPLAAIRVDSASTRDPGLLAATLAAFGLVLENAILTERSRAHLAELQAASARVVAAADTERRRIERNLHDGAQQRFLAVGLLIGELEASAPDPAVAAATAEIREHLQLALSELRDMAHGVHPGRIRLGLRHAVTELIPGCSFVVDLDITPHPLPETVTLTAYYAIAESLANVTKHARASHVIVRAQIHDNLLVVNIADDGRGGATAAPEGIGRGLGGLHDRVTAVGGRFELHSPPGKGTTVTVKLPCG